MNASVTLERNRCPDAVGQTHVLGCCTFTWTQEGSVRYAIVHAENHESCVQELLTAASSQGVVVVLVREPPGEARRDEDPPHRR
jgi:hypothetical protein